MRRLILGRDEEQARLRVGTRKIKNTGATGWQDRDDDLDG